MNIPSITDLVPDRDVLNGDKVRIESVLNLPLVVTGWEITRSKVKKDEQCLKLQFELNGELHVCFTGSTVLISQIEAIEKELEKRNLPRKFRASIRKIGKFFKFCNDTEETKP